MSYSYEALCAEYEADLARMVVTREGEVDDTARRLLKNLGRYRQVTARDGVPPVYIAASFEREASSDFRDNPANGDPLDRRTTDVPQGLGPYSGPNAWVDAAVDAYHLDHLDAVKEWTWARFCFEGEAFNGFGARMHGRRTGYLWAGTNIYDGGKYVADGVWSSSAQDRQLGIVPIAKRMAELDPSLDLSGAAVAASTPQPVTPATSAIDLQGVWALQASLNLLGADPHLVVDGNYGHMTRRAVRAFQRAAGLEADGVAGVETRAAIERKISEIKK